MLSRLKSYGILLRDILVMPIVILMPRNKKKILFGAWGGRSYSCNPKYLFEYMVRRGGFDCVWIGDEELRQDVLSLKGAKFARKGSALALWHFLTAKFLAFNVYWGDEFMRFPRCRRSVLLYLSHGYPDKRMGDRQFGGDGECETRVVKGFRALGRHALMALDAFLYGQEAWSSASSPQGDELRVLNMPWRLSMDRMLHAGTPRADFIIQNAVNQELKKELRQKLATLLGIPKNGRWVVFVPTWRHDPAFLYSFTTSPRVLEWQRFFEENDIVMIEKQHPKTLRDGLVQGCKTGRVCVVSAELSKRIDTQELLLASDVLITDYSSIYYDFYLMNRPVIHFTYDFEHAYTKDFGFDFDIREYGGGPFAYNEDELLKYMAMDDATLLSLRNEKTREQLSYETGHACEGYYNLIQKLTKK